MSVSHGNAAENSNNRASVPRRKQKHSRSRLQLELCERQPVSSDGKLVHVWKSNVWTPYEVQRMVRETLTGARDVAAKADSARKN